MEQRPKRRSELTEVDHRRIAAAEAQGYVPYHTKGDFESLEWWSPDGRFCIFEDLPEIHVNL